jgi:hypothetical protein
VKTSGTEKPQQRKDVKNKAGHLQPVIQYPKKTVLSNKAPSSADKYSNRKSKTSIFSKKDEQQKPAEMPKDSDKARAKVS